MVLEGTDGAFGGIDAVDARRDHLEVEVLAQILLERLVGFVV